MRPSRRAFLRAVGRGAATLSALSLVDAVTEVEAGFADDASSTGELERFVGWLAGMAR